MDFIIQYDSKGNYIRHFGGHGKGRISLSAVTVLQWIKETVNPAF